MLVFLSVRQWLQTSRALIGFVCCFVFLGVGVFCFGPKEVSSAVHPARTGPVFALYNSRLVLTSSGQPYELLHLLSGGVRGQGKLAISPCAPWSPFSPFSPGFPLSGEQEIQLDIDQTFNYVLSTWRGEQRATHWFTRLRDDICHL